MKVWILTAVLAVALIGGAAVAVTPDDGGPSDITTVAVDTLDIGDLAVALTLDAVAAHEQAQHAILVRSWGVPEYATAVASAPLNIYKLDDNETPERRQSKHMGKPDVTDLRQLQARNVGRVRLDRSHPLLC